MYFLHSFSCQPSLFEDTVIIWKIYSGVTGVAKTGSWPQLFHGIQLWELVRFGSLCLDLLLQVKGIDKVVPSLYSVWDEAQSPYFKPNVAASLDPAVDLEDENFVEGNLKHGINGFIFCNMPEVTQFSSHSSLRNQAL